jgi:hypothetical protein
VKQLGHEADDLPPSSAEVKNLWWRSSHVLLAWCLIKQRDNFTSKCTVAKLIKLSRDLIHIYFHFVLHMHYIEKRLQ